MRRFKAGDIRTYSRRGPNLSGQFLKVFTPEIIAGEVLYLESSLARVEQKDTQIVSNAGRHPAVLRYRLRFVRMAHVPGAGA